MSLIIIFPQELPKCSDFMLEFHCTELTEVLQCVPNCFEMDYLEFPFIKKVKAISQQDFMGLCRSEISSICSLHLHWHLGLLSI